MNSMGALKLICLILLTVAGKTTATSEGKSFVFAFSQIRSDFLEGECVIYINSKLGTNATLTDPDGASQMFSIQANVTYSTSYSYTYRVSEGVQTKGFLIEAVGDVSVMLSNYRDDNHLDTILVPPVTVDSQEYTVITYPASNDITCISSATCAFFTVTAYQDDTEVNVYKMVDGTSLLLQTETLQQQQVLTNRTTNIAGDRNYDFTGYYITANNSVSVAAGNPCADTNPQEVASQIWATMPLDQQAGTTHISHTLNYNDYYGPTIVRIMALADSTLVTYGGSETVINYKGEFLEYTLTSDESDVFECDKPCRAAQYSTNVAINPSGSAIFMVVLAPTDSFGHDVVYTRPDVGGSTSMVDYMSIVYLTETPEDSPVYNDGVALTGWTVYAGQGFSSVELEISGSREVFHTLTTASSNPGFSALIHGQANEGRGFGFIAGFGTSGDDSPAPIRPNPQYRIAMTGDFHSADGMDFTLTCTDNYSTEMNDVAASMIIKVNGLIGSSLCSTHTTSQIQLLTVSTPFVTNGNQGSTELRFIMKVNLTTITQDQVLTCGDEVGVYLRDHANWINPILPHLPNCPEVVFNSQMFNDSGLDWICFNSLKDKVRGEIPARKLQTTLKYTVSHGGLFSTVDGSVLTPGCVSDYNDVFDQSTFGQVQNVNGQISTGAMCADTGVTIETATASLTAQGGQGSSHQNYFLLLGVDTLAPDVFSCADEVSAFLSPHTNWVLPILPPVSGCPNVEFDPEVFNEDGQEWFCV